MQHIQGCKHSNSGDSSNNPLELLRVTYDPQQRAKLMQQLDTRMFEFSELYQPCPVEGALEQGAGSLELQCEHSC